METIEKGPYFYVLRGQMKLAKLEGGLPRFIDSAPATGEYKFLKLRQYLSWEALSVIKKTWLICLPPINLQKSALNARMEDAVVR